MDNLEYELNEAEQGMWPLAKALESNKYKYMEYCGLDMMCPHK